MPTLTPIDDGFLRFFWQIGSWEFEFNLNPESVACFKVALVTAILLVVAWSIQRWEGRKNAPHQK